MTYPWISAGLIALAVAVALLWQYYGPLRWKWPVSSSVIDGENQGSTGTFWDWWASHQSALGSRRVLKLDLATRMKIDRVTDALCDDFRYRLDPPDVDFEDVDIKTQLGDCEDYARVAALMLEKRGLDLGAMCLAFGASQAGFGWHCVLWIDTDQGAYVLSVGDRYAKPWAGFPITRETWQRAGNDGMYYAVVS